MLLKKLFKARKSTEAPFDPDEEPARVATPIPPNQELKKRSHEPPKPQKGFDPYNSGSFKRDNAWERVRRK
jgi:hypothetical protein